MSSIPQPNSKNLTSNGSPKTRRVTPSRSAEAQPALQDAEKRARRRGWLWRGLNKASS